MKKNVFNLPDMKASKKKTSLLLPLLVFSAGMIFRKTGWPFAAAIIVTGGFWLTASCLLTGIKKMKSQQAQHDRLFIPLEILFGICLGLILFQQQYWIHGPGLSWVSALIFTGTLLYAVIGKRNGSITSFIQMASWPTWVTVYFTALIAFLLITGLSLNPRQFHNFYRLSTYEEYLRSRFSELDIEDADKLLIKYLDTSVSAKEKASAFFILARNEYTKKNYAKALRLYNLSIDKDPQNGEAYFHRGYLKIHHLELNRDQAVSAALDFTESIRLQPNHAHSYFQRGATLGYLDDKKRVCEDMYKAFSLDTTLDVAPFIKKFCPIDSSAPVPFHP